eukprot:gene22541-29667_t
MGQREQWPSRLAFIFAAVGSAVGFGNVWRFPALSYEYGGGAFFIPYLVALFFIGIPLLFLELSVGYYYKTGDVGSFGKINVHLRGVGLGSVLCGFIVTTYYCPLLAWVVRMFFYTFSVHAGWRNAIGSEASDWFFDTVVGLGTVSDSQAPTTMQWVNVGCLAFVWLSVFLCLAFGIVWTGRFTYITMGLPIVALIIFLVRSVTLEGSSDGIKNYIGQWDISILTSRPDIWSTAVSQIFFSLGVCFGIMTAYGSYTSPNETIFANATIIAISNSLYSFVAGFAVFATVGHLAFLEGSEISDLDVGGIALIFGTWPVALSTLPGGGHWERLLFITLFLLGIDSAFSPIEGVITVSKDSMLLKDVSRRSIVAVTCVAGFLCGIPYCTDAGLYILDMVDFYVNFMLILVGFFECFSVGWMYGIEKQTENIGWKPVIFYPITTFGSVSVACAVWFGIEGDAVWPGFVAMFATYFIGMSVVLYYCFQVIKASPTEWSWRKVLYEILFSNVIALKLELEKAVGFVPLVWVVGLKHVISPILLFLFANLAASDNQDGKATFGIYGGYTMGFQIVGIVVVGIAMALIVGGVLYPPAYACFILKDEKAGEEECEQAEEG